MPCCQESPRATLRAVSSAVRLASEPPWVTSPENSPGAPADLLAEPLDHGPFGGRGPRAHVVDGHGLIGDRPDGVEQPGQRHRRGHLVADVAGVVQIVSVLQHRLHELGELAGQGIASGIRSQGRVQHRGGLAHVFGRIAPRQHLTLGRSILQAWSASRVDQSMAGNCAATRDRRPPRPSVGPR